jgi:uncharacterized DUF497 family protein
VRFIWDQKKATSNLAKHGVSFEEATSAFDDPLSFIAEDVEHSERLLLVGWSEPGRLLYVVHVDVSEDVIRIISARKATSHERRRYEEGT